jgi:hypothetical protein
MRSIVSRRMLQPAAFSAPPGAPFEAASRRLRARRLEKRPGRNAHFAARNETFRTAWHKSLKSLWAPNQSFRGIVCFQWLNSVFVSPFSRVVCFQWLSSIFISSLPRRVCVQPRRRRVRFERFQSVAAPFASHSAPLTPKAWSRLAQAWSRLAQARPRLANEKCEPGSPNFLKNNTGSRPAWQDFVA